MSLIGIWANHKLTQLSKANTFYDGAKSNKVIFMQAHNLVCAQTNVKIMLRAPCVTPTGNPCLSQPCQHGGLCSSVAQGIHGCTCRAGFTGQNCETTYGKCYFNLVMTTNLN